MNQSTPTKLICLPRTAWLLLGFCFLAVPSIAAEPLPAQPMTLPPGELKLKWEVKWEEGFETTPVVDGDVLIVADYLGKVVAFNKETGDFLWKYETDLGFSASPTCRDGMVVVGDLDGIVYALESKTGKELWRAETGGEISSAPAFHKSNVLVASQDGKLYCFQASNGTKQWEYSADDQIQCSPAIAGDRTLLGGCDKALHSVSLKDGSPASKPLPLDGPTGSTPAIVGDIAYVPTMNGTVFAINWKTQEVSWQYQDPKREQKYMVSAAANEELIVVASKFRKVDAINPDGTSKWTYSLRRVCDDAPVIAGNDVWLASTAGRLIRLDAATGEENWVYEIRGAFVARPLIQDGRLYITDEEGVIRCFGS